MNQVTRRTRRIRPSTQLFYLGIFLFLLLFGGGVAHSIFSYGRLPQLRVGYAEHHLRLLETRRQIDVIPDLRTAAALNFDDGYAQLKLLSSGYAVNHTDSILQGLRGLLSHTPNDPELHGELAIVLLNDGQLKDALVHSRRAVKLQPDSARLQIALGAVMLALGRNQQAADAYRKALVLSPDSETAQRALNYPLKNY